MCVCACVHIVYVCGQSHSSVESTSTLHSHRAPITTCLCYVLLYCTKSTLALHIYKLPAPSLPPYLKISIVFFIIVKAGSIFDDCLCPWTKPIGQELTSLKKYNKLLIRRSDATRLYKYKSYPSLLQKNVVSSHIYLCPVPRPIPIPRFSMAHFSVCNIESWESVLGMRLQLTNSRSI